MDEGEEGIKKKIKGTFKLDDIIDLGEEFWELTSKAQNTVCEVCGLENCGAVGEETSRGSAQECQGETSTAEEAETKSDV